MPIRPLLLYPDPGLRRPAAPVTRFDDGLSALAADIAETMAAHQAIGLSACHVGDYRRLVVLRLDPGAGPEVFVNPAVTWVSPETGTRDEGSVSMPGIYEPVTRPARIRLTWQDLDGTAREGEAADWRAACLMHEIDQLDGVFWLARLSRLRRDRALKRFGKRA
ncbi:peptide deformylase [Zavarzinia compransoris]|uniref:Peptide deformylase-like n=1 Tax=Zavarzinia compransoris TaxID=1264899 RepID=A0A317DYC5_9PROT|nr:peptide deformylase [Zavarzinia compransoris]PWR18856.1 peptide deformylase [Zavarzinia compransoris]TDP48849.1 peptide deformylase [Zavarzinia compransoris]